MRTRFIRLLHFRYATCAGIKALRSALFPEVVSPLVCSVFLSFFFAGLLPQPLCCANGGGQSPNIIFVLCDDLGWGDFGVLHQNASQHVRRHRTPNIDRMALEGMQLRAHYCPAPVCAPSRASLLTGVHQGHAQVRDNQFDKMLADNHTLGTVLQAAGYRTAMIGKYGLQGKGENPREWPGYPTKRGFNEFFGYVRHRDGHVHYPADRWELGDTESHRSPKQVWHNNEEVSRSLSKCYTTDLFTARSKKWIIEHTEQYPERPFFLYLAFDTPHAALQVPTSPYPPGGGTRGGVQWLGKPGRMINTATGRIDSYRHPEYASQGWSDVEVRFATMVRRIDSCVGDLLQTLKDLKLDKNTLVVISSDNGPLNVSYIKDQKIEASAFQSYGPFEGIKRDTWEGGIRMATIAWGPGFIPAGTIDDHPSQFHDWMPTFSDFAGVPAPARTDGVSLKPTLTGKGQQEKSLIYVEYLNGGKTPNYSDFDVRRRGRKRGQMQVIHLDGFKGIRTNIRSHKDPFEIYDVVNDPKERRNLAGTSKQMRRLGERMREEVLRCRIPNEASPRPYDAEPIPATRDTSIRELPNGVSWKHFVGDFPFVPRTQNLTADQAGNFSNLKLSTREFRSGAMEVAGWLRIPNTGRYLFQLESDSPAFFRVHNVSAIDHDHSFREDRAAIKELNLAEGWHPFRITFLTGNGANSVELLWATDGREVHSIPKEYLHRVAE